MPPPRKLAKAKTVSGARDALQALAAGLPQPPKGLALAPTEMVFWASIMKSRLPGEWAEIDMVQAAHLARTLAEIEVHRKALKREGHLVTTKSGWKTANPRHPLIEMLLRRSMSLTRLLQIHSVPRGANLRDQGARKAEALAANQTMESLDDDDLLARPTMQ